MFSQLLHDCQWGLLKRLFSPHHRKVSFSCLFKSQELCIALQRTYVQAIRPAGMHKVQAMTQSAILYSICHFAHLRQRQVL